MQDVNYDQKSDWAWCRGIGWDWVSCDLMKTLDYNENEDEDVWLWCIRVISIAQSRIYVWFYCFSCNSLTVFWRLHIQWKIKIYGDSMVFCFCPTASLSSHSNGLPKRFIPFKRRQKHWLTTPDKQHISIFERTVKEKLRSAHIHLSILL